MSYTSTVTQVQNQTTTAVAKTATPAQKTSAKKIAAIATLVIGTLAAAAGLVYALRSGVTPGVSPLRMSEAFKEAFGFIKNCPVATQCPVGSDEAFIASKAFAANHCLSK